MSKEVQIACGLDALGPGVLNRLVEYNFDPGCLRPWKGKDGRSYIALNNGGSKPQILVTNTTSTLPVRAWIELDEAVMVAGRQRLRFVKAIRDAGLSKPIPNGMGVTVFESQKISDVGSATFSMDAMRQTPRDRPYYDLDGVPLYFVHSDFGFSAVELAQTKLKQMPLDMSMAEMEARRCAEALEDLFLGVVTPANFGGYSLQGATNLTGRNTKTLANPTSSGWTPEDTLDDILDMKSTSQQDKHYGPWILFVGQSWDAYLDKDYSAAKGTISFRDRVKQINGITDIITVDRLTGYQMLLLQMTQDVVRALVAMEMTTLQWQEMGGLYENFKLMGKIVPQFRVDANGNSGLVHGNVA